ncbi:MAG TPA: hypothetical protein VGJ17_02830 [Candidatus Limnocylindrales bacterium]
MSRLSRSTNPANVILAAIAVAMAAFGITVTVALVTGSALGSGGKALSVPPGAVVATASASLSSTPLPPPSPSASPSAAPPKAAGPFAMDLYHKGDYVGELTKIWCLPAAMQTSMNIMDAGADTTRATQARIFSLARKLAPAPDGAAEPEGWAKGLTKLGYGAYAVTVKSSIADAIHLVARQIRLTNRPAGLMVWRGAHSWVVSGFTATADPAVTDRFTVTAVRIEDVWYPRFSTIWGYSRPPDALVPVSALSGDYLPWKRPTGRYPGKDGKFVAVVPTT